MNTATTTDYPKFTVTYLSIPGKTLTKVVRIANMDATVNDAWNFFEESNKAKFERVLSVVPYVEPQEEETEANQ